MKSHCLENKDLNQTCIEGYIGPLCQTCDFHAS